MTVYTWRTYNSIGEDSGLPEASPCDIFHLGKMMAYLRANEGSANYYILAGTQVEAWSTVRLPFEPKGWQQTFRQDLWTAIGSLVAAPEQVLHAVYISSDRSLCDTENVLFYNIGGGAFVKAARLGLRFERVYAGPPPCPIPLSSEPLHYHRYSLQPHDSSFTYWQEGDVLARWNASPDKVTSSSGCASIWYAVKKGISDVAVHEKSEPKQYGLWALLITPSGIDTLPASTVKVVFDGIISALHYHDGSKLLEVSSRVSKQLGEDAQEVASLLSASKGTILGKRRLLHPWGVGVQWNPADDACLVGEFIIQQDSTAQNWELSGELFEIS